MNFLAHAVLAGPLASDRVGGLMGDFVKGVLPAGLPPELASGVALHRAIDSFAESNEAFKQSRARISAIRRRVGGILVDLFYDHLLARDWELHQPGIMLETYTQNVYQELVAFTPLLPERARDVADSMRRYDWLSSYRSVGALENTIERMAVYRFKRANPLPGGIREFLENPEGFEEDFRAFFADAMRFADQWRHIRDEATSGAKHE